MNINITIGFNWYLIFGPIMVLAIGVLGAAQFEIGCGLRLRRKFNKKFIAIVAEVFAVIFALLVFFESFAGLVDWLDGGLAPTDSPAWSVILAPSLALFIGMTFYYLLRLVAEIAGLAKEGNLIEYIRAQKRLNQ